jgi:hypothetical protein
MEKSLVGGFEEQVVANKNLLQVICDMVFPRTIAKGV